MFDLRALLKKKEVALALYVAFVGLSLATVIQSSSLNNQNSFLNDHNTSLNDQSKHVAEATRYPFKLTITLEKDTYKLYEPINIMVTLKNVREENTTIVFLTAGNPDPYWFWRVYDKNDQVVFYHKYCVMLGALEEVTLQPVGFMQRKYTWDQKVTKTAQQVLPGIYYLVAVVGFMYNEEHVHLETRIEICINL